MRKEIELVVVSGDNLIVTLVEVIQSVGTFAYGIYRIRYNLSSDLTYTLPIAICNNAYVCDSQYYLTSHNQIEFSICISY